MIIGTVHFSNAHLATNVDPYKCDPSYTMSDFFGLGDGDSLLGDCNPSCARISLGVHISFCAMLVPPLKDEFGEC